MWQPSQLSKPTKKLGLIRSNDEHTPTNLSTDRTLSKFFTKEKDNLSPVAYVARHSHLTLPTNEAKRNSHAPVAQTWTVVIAPRISDLHVAASGWPVPPPYFTRPERPAFSASGSGLPLTSVLSQSNDGAHRNQRSDVLPLLTRPFHLTVEIAGMSSSPVELKALGPTQKKDSKVIREKEKARLKLKFRWDKGESIYLSCFNKLNKD